jgi:hypothetical protein
VEEGKKGNTAIFANVDVEESIKRGDFTLSWWVKVDIGS